MEILQKLNYKKVPEIHLIPTLYPESSDNSLVKGFYYPIEDEITIYNFKILFPSLYNYILLHELAHATGHEKRLCRPFIKNHDKLVSSSKSKYKIKEIQEELVVESAVRTLIIKHNIIKPIDNEEAYDNIIDHTNLLITKYTKDCEKFKCNFNKIQTDITNCIDYMLK